MFTGRHHYRTCRFLLASIAIGLLAYASPQPAVWGQLKTLSAGDADQQWREAQLQAFDRQLADEKLPKELIREIKAQRAWLEDWDPKSQSAGAEAGAESATTKSPAAEAPADEAAGKQSTQEEQKQKQDKAGAKDLKPLDEPNIDPEGRAKELRARLFDPKRPATAADTKALQTALAEHSGDVGLRQLQLHWLDQPIYRDTHWQEISNAADRVLALLADLPASEETKAAAAYANYRKARALAHALGGRSLRGGKIAGVDKLSADEREQLENAIAECWRQIETLVGAGHREFFQLELYNLRRYGWSGQALELLERHADAVDPLAYLAERQSILEALHWTAPAERTAAELKAKSAAGDAKSTRPLEIQYAPEAEK
ncbi:MAG: hypothetical protein ACTHK7_18320 [Aureliella sp.]